MNILRCNTVYFVARRKACPLLHAWMSEILAFHGRVRRVLPGNKENMGKMMWGTKEQGFCSVVISKRPSVSSSSTTNCLQKSVCVCEGGKASKPGSQGLLSWFHNTCEYYCFSNYEPPCLQTGAPTQLLELILPFFALEYFFAHVCCCLQYSPPFSTSWGQQLYILSFVHGD